MKKSSTRRPRAPGAPYFQIPAPHTSSSPSITFSEDESLTNLQQSRGPDFPGRSLFNSPRVAMPFKDAFRHKSLTKEALNQSLLLKMSFRSHRRSEFSAVRSESQALSSFKYLIRHKRRETEDSLE